jgi:hypothetical protein
MKVIFLDIDGVLNSSKTRNPRKLPYVAERKLVARLRKLVRSTGAKVVLISSWRYDPAGLFSAKHHGIPFFDCAPDLPHRSRCEEIQRWLKAHPRATRFAVIDDDDDELDTLPLFQPNPHEGLTTALARKVALFLAGKTNEDARRSRFVRVAENAVNVLKGHSG